MIMLRRLLNKTRSARINPYELTAFAILIYVFKSIHPMWIHPDSMTAGGLRLLSGDWSTFHFATYGPFAFMVSGVMTGLLFPVGFVIGSWKTITSFEEAYRTNHVEVLNISFTNFSLLINLILISLSLKILAKIFLIGTHRKFRGLNLFLLFLAIPISLNQLTLDTIEIYTFFGISVALYVSFFQIRRKSTPKFFDYSLVTASFLLTVGMRISLAIFIIPVHLFIAILQFRRNRNFSEFVMPFVAILVSLTSYLPLILNSVELKLSIEMYRSLGSLDFGAETIGRNLVVLLLNSGVSLFLIVPTLFLTLRAIKRKNIMEEQALLLIWFSLALVHLSLFLFNLNGFPKYLIPIFPISLVFIDHAFRLDTLNQLKYLRDYKRSILILISFTYMILGIINYNNFQIHSRFDTREVIMQILPETDRWMKETSANITVITELSRGKYGITYQEIVNRISPFEKGGSDCKKLLILSTREINIKQMPDAVRKCGFEIGSYSIVEISPYLDPSKNESSEEWLGFLSLGTPVDPNRKGYGPLYELFIQRDWVYASDLLSNCTSSQYCRIIRN